jgi:hypothetical protein
MTKKIINNEMKLKTHLIFFKACIIIFLILSKKKLEKNNKILHILDFCIL